MKNHEAAVKTGIKLSEIAVDSIFYNNNEPEKEEYYYVKKFEDLLNKSLKYKGLTSGSSNALLSLNSNDLNLSIINTLYNSLIKSEIGNKYKLEDYVISYYNNELVEREKLASITLSEVLKRLSMDLGGEINKEEIIQSYKNKKQIEISRIKNEIANKIRIPEININMPDHPNICSYYRTNFNIKNAWIIRQLIYDNFSEYEFFEQEHIKS